MVKPTKPAKAKLFNVRISGQIAANSEHAAAQELAKCIAAYPKIDSPMIDGGIVRITPAEGA